MPDYHDILTSHGWTAEYESGDTDDGPTRYVYGSTGYRGHDPILMLHRGEMAISKHPTLDLSVWGIAGTIASVDLETTPVEEIPAKIAEFACSNLSDMVANAASALRCAHTLPAEPIKPIDVGDEF